MPQDPSTPRVLTGIPAAPGLAQGPAVLWREEALPVPQRQAALPDGERGRLHAARAAARAEIERLKAQVEATAGSGEAAVFQAHLMFLDDPALVKLADSAIDTGWNAEAAWADAVEHFAGQLDRLPDPTLRARAADVRDVGRRVLGHLLGKMAQVLELRQPSVVVARDLAPSQVASLDRERLLALCLAAGGPTSHAAILARAWGVPAVVGLGPSVLAVSESQSLLVDGSRGEVVVNPDAHLLRAFRERAGRAAERAGAERAAAREPAVTRDGHRVEVVANVGAIEETAAALDAGAGGIGLLRTEFLYLNRTAAPGEEGQLDAYRVVLKAMGSRSVIARTLDVGGDKPLPYLPLDREPNPFLGYRAIRILLDHPDVLKIQFRALLRASPGHDLRIMFPLVTTLDELRRAKALFQEARDEVRAAGHAATERIPLGMMVEVPAAVALADRFAREVDFFSIGTNDLTQYTMAADRGNEKVAHLNDGCHPAVLRQIQRVIEAGHQAGIWVGVCGELAGDPDAVPVLLGLGLDEFSIAAAAIPRAKAIIRRWSLAEARRLAAEAINLDSAAAVRERVRAYESAA